VHTLHAERLTASIPSEERAKGKDELPVWSVMEALKRHGQNVVVRGQKRRRVLVLVDGCLCDVGGYLEDHVSLAFSI
jgi:stearoyl-CoA desaturase (delta-9 desaturase)